MQSTLSNINPIIIGIDASNLRAGGGFNHLPQILESLDPNSHGIKQIIVWGNQKILQALPERTWLRKSYSFYFDQSIIKRTYWQQCLLPKILSEESCNILFSPGGNAPHNITLPTVVMSRNMLPFEKKEYSRYPILSYSRLRLEALRKSQSRSFVKATGVIFLTQYAQSQIQPFLSKPLSHSIIIPHGIDRRFFLAPRLQITEFTREKPFRFLYVSTIDLYKHQWQVARAAKILRNKGYPIVVDFVGSNLSSIASKMFQDTLREVDPERTFLHHHQNLNFKTLHQIYHNADAFIFASTCENLPNILLEAMASGLPIATTNKGPMTEVLGKAGLTFDAESPVSIADSMVDLFCNPKLRETLAEQAYAKAHQYSWKTCADQTFSFITQIARKVPT